MKVRIAAFAWFAMACLLFTAPRILRAATADDYYKAGLTLTQQNQHEQAVKYYQAAVQLDANHWQAEQAMGTSYYQLGNKSEALAAFDASLKIHPDNPQLKAFADSLRSQVSAASTPAPATGFSTAPTYARKKTIDNGKWKSMGVRMALVLSQLTGPNNTGSKMSMGFGGGVFYTLGLSPKLGIQPEIWYLPKGGKNNYTISELIGGSWYDSVYDIKINATYVEIPLLVKYYFGSERKQGFLIGPAFGFLMGAKAKGSITDLVDGVQISSTPIDQDMKKEYKSSDLSLIIGATRNFGKLQVEVRYGLGLSNISATDGDSVKNNVMMGTLGYSF